MRDIDAEFLHRMFLEKDTDVLVVVKGTIMEKAGDNMVEQGYLTKTENESGTHFGFQLTKMAKTLLDFKEL